MTRDIEEFLAHAAKKKDEDQIYFADKIIPAIRLVKQATEQQMVDLPADKTIYGEVKCPNCEDGIIQYRRSGYDGHTRGLCTTKHCLNWTE